MYFIMEELKNVVVEKEVANNKVNKVSANKAKAQDVFYYGRIKKCSSRKRSC
nr:MAG TPA: hypothetical protein [Caudoviricetes sp.]